MNTKRFYLTASSILLIFILVACGPAATAAPTAVPATSIPATSVPATAIPATSVPTPAAAAPTAALGASASGDCANAYYPVPSGTSRSFSSTGGSNGPYTYTQTVTTVSNTGFSTDYKASTGVAYTFKWTCQGGNLAALDAGPGSFAMSTSKVTMASDSVAAVGYNIPASFDSGATWSEDITVDGTVTQTATGKTEKSQIISQTSCTAAGTDSVTVPAGKFDTAKATCTKKVVLSFIVQGKSQPINSNTENNTYWYAKGVGFVKSIATGGSNNETVVLTEYKIP
jgi:hypothetical protein